MIRLYSLFSLLGVLARLCRPGGVRALVAENMALRQQLLVVRRHRQRAPKLTHFDRLTFGFLAGLIHSKRLSKIAIILKPTTLLKFHQALVKRKYRHLYSAKTPKKPGPKGPSQTVVDAILEMKQRNPRFGYRRIAMQITLAFGIEMDKDTVRRVLNQYPQNTPKDKGPSWLTFLGHMKDSLWSLDLFRCESIHLKTHWVMLVMDQFTRRLIGLAVRSGDLGGIEVCCLFNKIISKKSLPKYISSDNDPLFTFHRWKANMRILEIEEIKTIPYVPISHPFVERLIGTIRHECMDHLLFWTSNDCQNKLDEFFSYYNSYRGHGALMGKTPLQQANTSEDNVISLSDYRWQSHCRGLMQLPKAA